MSAANSNNSNSYELIEVNTNLLLQNREITLESEIENQSSSYFVQFPSRIRRQ